MVTVNEQSSRQTLLKRILSFSIIPKEDKDQTIRMQRFMMAFASYTLCCILAYLSYLAGIMEWRGLIGLLLICSFNNIVFYVAFRTGLNLRASDPSLTTIQMCAAVVALTYGMYFANESRPVLLLVYVIILMFGIFRLVLSGFLFVSLFMIASYGLNLFLLYRFRFQDVNFKMEFLHMLLFALMLVALSVIGSYISILRKKLHKAMCVNLELSIRDELTGAYNVFCKTFFQKVANHFSIKLQLHFPESCKIDFSVVAHCSRIFFPIVVYN